MQLGLGTVQFGLDYGISNTIGQTPLEKVQKILRVASSQAIQVLDTASLYQESETVLGKALQGKPSPFRIITKTPQFKKNKIGISEVQELRQRFDDSLQKLNQPKITGLLIHHANDLLVSGGEKLFEAMQKLQQKRLLDKIGVSVYSVIETERILKRYPLDLIQLPMNVLDQRFLRSGLFTELKSQQVEIHVRSVFLQGLLLMPLEQIPSYFSPILPLLRKYHSLLKEYKLSLLQGAFVFLKRQKEIHIILVGVSDQNQLLENIQAIEYPSPIDIDFHPFSIEQEEIINPSFWQIA